MSFDALGVLRRPVAGPLGVMLAAAAILGVAFYFQYGMGLAPCRLCHWQRLPYYAGIPLAGLGLWANVRSGASGGRATAAGSALLGLAGLGFLVGAGIAVYHVGVEQHLWAGPDACSGAAGGGVPGGVDDLLATPVVRCDQVPWSLFGISMAGYNAVLSLGLAAFALGTAFESLREPRT